MTVAIPVTDPFATAPADAALTPSDARENLTKGMPSRKLRTFGVALVGIGIAAFMIWPKNNKQIQDANKQASDVASTENEAPGAMLVKRLNEEANERARLKQLEDMRLAEENASAKQKIRPPAGVGLNPNATDSNQAFQDISTVTPAQAAALRREQIIASPTEAAEVILKSQNAGGTSKSETLAMELERESKAAMAEATQRRAESKNTLASLLGGSGVEDSSSSSAKLQRGQNELFLDRYGKNDDPGVTHSIAQRNGSTLYQGTLIRSVLERGINTDLPGAIRAKVTSDVYDSIQGRVRLIPRGSILLGEYSTGFVVGQSRVLVAMTRMILPSGKSVSLLGTPVAGMDGVSGMPAEVNNHFWAMFGSSLIVGASSLLLPKENQTTTTTTGNGQTQNSGTIAAQSLQQTLQTLASRNRNIQPTGTVELGSEFLFMISRDMSMTEKEALN